MEEQIKEVEAREESRAFLTTTSMEPITPEIAQKRTAKRRVFWVIFGFAVVFIALIAWELIEHII